jgi:hypothetical protein
MLLSSAALVLGLLPSFALSQTIKTDAQCLAGFDWMFSSVNQSPCDVAAELAGVCVGGQFNLQPLSTGYVYLGPSVANANSCRCSSVYYSLLSGCAYCQGRNYIKWSAYNVNCSTVYSQVFIQPIPVGVKVPTWAYQNVDVSDNFNVTLAQNTKGIESSRAAAVSSTGSKTSTGQGPSDTGAAASSNSTNIPAIVGGAVGGIVGLALIGGLIAFLIVQRKKASTTSYQQGFQPQNMTYTPNTTASLVPPTRSPPPGSPARVYDPNDPATYPAVDGHNTGNGSFHTYAGADPYRQQSPFTPQSVVASNYTGNSAQQYMPPSQNMPTHGTPNRYTGAPEL